MKSTIAFISLALIISHSPLNAQEIDPFDAYLDEFVAALDIPISSDASTTPVWTVPEELVFGGKTWAVSDESGSTPRLDHLYKLSCSSVESNIIFRVYPQFSTSTRSKILGWALGGPSSLPAESLAASFSVSTNNVGTVFVVPPTGNFIVAIHGNSIVRADTHSADRMDLVLALLRAGGVNIPDEPAEPPSNPRR